MRSKILLIYAWLVRTLLFFWPDIPVIMRFRGWLYGFGMKKCGANFQVTHSAILNSINEFTIGTNVYIGNGCSFIANGEITIGNNVLFGPNVVVSSGNHIYHDGQLQKKSYKTPVVINDNCWVAANCTLVGGACLPKQSILAAGAVLNKNFSKEDSGVYGGVPAKFIKKL